MIILLLDDICVGEDYRESISPLIMLHQISNNPTGGGKKTTSSKHYDNVNMEDTSITSSTHRDERTILKKEHDTG